MSEDGRALKTLHRILIGSAIGLGVLMVIFAAVRWARGDSSFLVTGAIGAVGAFGFALYLRWFVAKSRN